MSEQETSRLETIQLTGQNRFPYKIGFDCSGVVTEIGSAVARIHVGDEVYARLPEVGRGKDDSISRPDELRED